MSKYHCWICDKEYDYCPHCKRYETLKSKTCSGEHYQIHIILQEFREGVLTKAQAKKKFNNIGIDKESDFSNMIPAVAKDIKKILNIK